MHRVQILRAILTSLRTPCHDIHLCRSNFVRSITDHNIYNAIVSRSGWICSCRDYNCRNIKCKHAVEFYRRLSSGLVQLCDYICNYYFTMCCKRWSHYTRIIQYMSIHPKFAKFITLLRTAAENGEDVSDKEATSHEDLLDAFTLSLMFWY